jgi:citrate/tricarballylate utilization protein
MPPDDRLARGAHVMTVCNACRYCEQFCPVFPAMERRLTFEAADLSYLANLCHNCGECLYACQYAPPHEFGINVPRTLAEIRLRSYEVYAWPRPCAALFRRQGLAAALGSSALFTMMLAAAAMIANPAALAAPAGRFYAVVPHGVLVALFGSVFGFSIVAMLVGVLRFAREMRLTPGAILRAGRPLLDGLRLRHLHASGADCVAGEEQRHPLRRWCHHAILWGFALSCASTSVAAVYHALGWIAPYGYGSVPVVLGALGGVGLLGGSLGSAALRTRRDPMMGDPGQAGLDTSLLALLAASSLTGLLLLVARESRFLAVLLFVHLGTVLALFVLAPYGKFVHGFYRLAALLAASEEQRG